MAHATPSPSSDEAFLEAYDDGDFPRPSVAVDVVVLSCNQRSLQVVLGRRQAPPQRGRWALPGGFVGIDETLDAAAARVLASKAGLTDVFCEQLYTFGAVDRDPRSRVISVAYYALLPAARLQSAIDGQKVRLAEVIVPWSGEAGGPVDCVLDRDGSAALAFDHGAIIGMAVKRLRGKVAYSTVGYELLPDSFTMRALQRVHESILGERINKDSFRRRMQATGELRATGESEHNTSHRPAELFQHVRSTR